MKLDLSKAIGLAIAAAGLSFSVSSHAALGDTLYASGGDIIVTFEGGDAGYNSLISVNGGLQFFPNHATAVGTTYDLGTFAAGTLLSIALDVTSTGTTFFTGPASGNPDDLPHANVIYDYLGTPGLTYVGFEDTFGGGDQDYNDHQFAFTNITPVQTVPGVPEPETYALMLAGLGFLGWFARRRQP
jgi:PEP-CTERM motif